jgi:hypothetical protein
VGIPIVHWVLRDFCTVAMRGSRRSGWLDKPQP